MNPSQIVESTAAHVRELLGADATGHDWHHVERVRRNALAIAREEGADLFVVELAALLHDIADWKFHGGDELAGSRAARAWLESLHCDQKAIDHVCRIIDGLSFKGAGVATNMPTLEGAAVQDADRLEAMGAIGVARAFAYGGAKGRLLYAPDHPPEMHASFEAYKKNAGPTLNHFYEKLLLLKDRMQTAAGRRLAQERHQYLADFVARFLAEWHGTG
jgi:uncharacterized protein